MNLVWTRDADADILEIWSYSLKQWGPVTAADYIERIADHAEALAQGEISGTDEGAVRSGLRRQVVGSHALWFRIEGADLIVIRVLHQNRDAGRWVG